MYTKLSEKKSVKYAAERVLQQLEKQKGRRAAHKLHNADRAVSGFALVLRQGPILSTTDFLP
jgi:hypothetical protein